MPGRRKESPGSAPQSHHRSSTISSGTGQGCIRQRPVTHSKRTHSKISIRWLGSSSLGSLGSRDKVSCRLGHHFVFDALPHRSPQSMARHQEDQQVLRLLRQQELLQKDGLLWQQEGAPAGWAASAAGAAATFPAARAAASASASGGAAITSARGEVNTQGQLGQAVVLGMED